MTKKEFAKSYPKTYDVFQRSKFMNMDLDPFYRRVLNFIDCEFNISCEPILTLVGDTEKEVYKVQISKNGQVLDTNEKLFETKMAADKSITEMAVSYVENHLLN